MIEEIREELRLFNCGFNTSDRVIKCHNNILKILDKYNNLNKGIDELRKCNTRPKEIERGIDMELKDKDYITQKVNDCFYYSNGYIHENKENIVPAIVNKIINYIEEEKSKAILETKVFAYEEIIKKSNFKTVVEKKTKEVEE